ncbi:MAG TPA: sugar phosphate isomerase/epimerase [Pseudonocardiaceae bacterium]
MSQPLVISSYTLGTEASFEERVRAAAAAGFAGIGLRAENYVDARRAGLDDAAMHAVLREHGMTVMEVEYLTGWGTEGDRDAAQQEKERTVFHLARTFGVGHLNAGLLEKPPLDAVPAAFGALCRRAGELTVALEFMPYSGVPDLATAWAVVDRCGEPNSALLVDAWHWTRSRAAPDDLGPVPAERIVSIQLCDVAAEPMPVPRQESLHHRLPPGRGFGDVAGMLRALRDHGVRPVVIAVEVISDELVARGVDGAARTVMAAAREVLDRSWSHDIPA